MLTRAYYYVRTWEHATVSIYVEVTKLADRKSAIQSVVVDVFANWQTITIRT